MPESGQTTRYEKVKQILDQAAAGSSSDYDGLGAFWQLSLREFLEIEIRGIRMIAPAAAEPHSCCHATPEDSAESRSARSGLIRGLRGEAPFNGTQFPRLPWGGKSVGQACWQ